MGDLDNQVAEFLLNGMPLHEFIGWLVLAVGGALVYVLIRFIYSVKIQKEEYQKKKMKDGLLRLLVSIMIIPWIILWFEDVAPVLLEFLFDTGDEHTVIGLNGISAPAIGFLVDRIIHRLHKKVILKK